MPDDEDDAIARARAAKKGSPFLNTAQAAAYLGLGPRKLEELRNAGQGPRFRRHTSFVRYHVDDLIAWSEETAGRPRGPVKPARKARPKKGEESDA